VNNNGAAADGAAVNREAADGGLGGVGPAGMNGADGANGLNGFIFSKCLNMFSAPRQLLWIPPMVDWVGQE
jgi:hypothetical protein